MNQALDIDKVDTAELVESDREHMWHHLTPHDGYAEGKDPLVIVRGDGMKVWNQAGKEHIDGVSGAVWTVNVGYGRESIANAVRDQLIDLCYFAGSAAYKMVRQISALHHDGKKHKILYRDRDYHGTTITALSSSGHQERKAQYGPYTPGFIEVPHCCEYRCQYDDATDYGVKAAKEIETIIQREGPDSVGSIVLEPITAGGGVITPPEGYWETVQEICKKYGVLLHIDEVVCGVGRTGTWFGYQHYGVKPDIVTMAKGVASGYAAISCTVTTEEVFNLFKSNEDPMGYFRDISTFGGCTAGPAAALENMKIIEEENLLENTIEMGDYLIDKLRGLQNKHKCIGDVRGKGLFCGAELVVDRQTKEPMPESVVAAIAADCMDQGVIIGRTNRSLVGLNNTITLSPALICTADDIDQIVAAIDTAITNQAAKYN